MEWAGLEARIAALVSMINPHVSNIVGCGALVSADLLINIGDNPERIHSEAALAHLCGGSIAGKLWANQPAPD